MKTKRPESAYLLDMKRAARLAIEFVQGLSREQFEKDVMRQSAVVRQLEILGEAATHVSKDFRSAHPEIAWSTIIGMRNILIHLYHEADLEIIWKTTQGDLPEFLKKIEPLVS